MKANTVSKPTQYFHHRGWIATKFVAKQFPINLFKSKKRNVTEFTHDLYHKPGSTYNNIPFRSQEMPKPSTAPLSNHRNKRQIIDNFQQLGKESLNWQEPKAMQTRYSNFKTTIGNRKQLLFIKPYTRYQNKSLTIDQKKTEIYREINNPDVYSFNDSFPTRSKVIEYFTEYKEPFTERPKPQEAKIKNRNRTSINVLRQKLRRKCESGYRSRLQVINSQ